MRKSNFPVEWINEFEDIFEHEKDCYLLLDSDGGVTGRGFGIESLKLIANCMDRYFEFWGEPKSPPSPARDESSRAVQIREELLRLASECEGWFIVCYQLDGSKDWRMVWSTGLSAEEVYEEMFIFVHQIPH